ncbi:antitoxin Phd [Tomitella gaofuii]|uniref:antitoxin Phd n=1 Tax=Tomitella gaofuii TaxID=2760083 RepID=UPI0015F80BEA|nr:antitoxin Phd [Tomitella gaofuii]
MPALNIPFTDEEMAALRASAAESNQSMRAFAHAAVLAAADRHKKRVAAATELVARRSSELNRRLA